MTLAEGMPKSQLQTGPAGFGEDLAGFGEDLKGPGWNLCQSEVLDLPSVPDPPSVIRRVRLGGCLVDLVCLDMVRRVLDDHLGRPPGTGTLNVASANLDHITHFGGCPEGDELDPGRMGDWLVLLDGFPLVRAARRLTGTDYPCLAGSDLLPELFTLAEVRERSVAVLGGRQEIVEPLGAAIHRRWPSLRVVGHLTPSRAELLDPASSRRIQTDLAALSPDLLVVALGKPLQELWMREYARGTGARVVVAFGAAIDFIAGTVPRAPKRMQRLGLEWCFRLLREPRRMAYRYLVQGPAALAKLRSDQAVLPPGDESGWCSDQWSVRRSTSQPPVPEPAAAPVAGHQSEPNEARDSQLSQCDPVLSPSPGRGPCTAVVVTYQSAQHVGALLQALEAEREAGLDLDVVVVDQASTDGTAEVVARFAWVRWMSSGGNLGYAAGVNLGDRLTPPGRPLFVLNPDLVPVPGALGRMLDALDDPEVGVVVPRVDDADGVLSPSLRYEPAVGRALVDTLLGRRAALLPRGWSEMLWDPRAYETEQSPDWAVGAALLLSGACRAAAGEWDERYFLYSEETDYLRRVRAAGLRVRYVPDAVVRHSLAGSGSFDGLYALHVVNAARYYRRHHRLLSSLAFGAVCVLHELLRMRRSGARLALRALLSARVRSTLPGPTLALPVPDALGRDALGLEFLVRGAPVRDAPGPEALVGDALVCDTGRSRG
jgi:exopolysaccharide biosynthesis WecB/TagA/CpsF family protein